MNKPYSNKDMAFELYLQNYPMDRIVYIADETEDTINQWILEGNWKQLKDDLDATPLLRDLGRRMAPDQQRLFIMEFIAWVMLRDFEFGSKLFTMNKKFLSGEEPFPDMDTKPDPTVLN